MGASHVNLSALMAEIEKSAAAFKAAKPAVETAAPLPAPQAQDKLPRYTRGSTTAPLGGYVKGMPTAEKRLVDQLRELRDRLEALSPSEALTAGPVLRAMCEEIESELAAMRY
ncbi:MAG: hypothetical protein ABFD50_04705 [Smithella sp.]